MSRQDARRFVVANDVADDARRTRMAHVLERYGDRVQYSVFVVALGAAGLVRMKAEVVAVMKPEEDSVLLCDLGPPTVSRLGDSPISDGYARRPHATPSSFDCER
jgi:CRISPR-associated protein Cas2